MAYTYILYSIYSRIYYIGACRHLEERMRRHNQGRVPFTSRHTPWKLVWYAEKSTFEEATKLEHKLKNFKSKKRIEEFVQKYSD